MRYNLLKSKTTTILLTLFFSASFVLGQGTVTLNAASSGSTLNAVPSGAGAGQFNCGANFTDGSGNYSNRSTPYTTTLCAAPGQYLSVTFTLVDVASGGPGNTDIFTYNNGGGNIATGEIGGGGGNPASLTIESSIGGCITFTLTTNNDGGSGANLPSANTGFSGIVTCVAPPSNDDPCGALPLSAFNTCSPTLVSNVGALNTTGVPAVSGCVGYNGSDVWYSVTVPADGNISFQSSAGTITDGGLAAYTSSNGTCTGTFTQITCNDDCGSPVSLMPCLNISNPALAGQTIWIRVYEYGGNLEGDFSVCAIGNVGSCTPTSSDCAGAIPLCSDSPVSNLASGQGCSADLNSGNDGCLAGEHNSTWFLIQIGSTGGTWGFDGVFDVSSNGIEYDWALWQVSDNPLTAPAVCSGLTAPIRCSYASQAGKSEVAMGMNAAELPQTSEGSSPSGNGYVGWLTNALPGEYYLLMVDRWATAGGAFTLDFTGTASMDCAITTLPIELLSFRGERNGSENWLNWTTASEINNDFFTIEKSKDQLEWEVLGVMKGAGSSQEILNYSMADREPYASVTYYRLRQTDFDGKDKLSYTITIVSTVEADGLFTELYPNPTNGNFYFNYAGKNLNAPIEVTLYNSSGKLIKAHSFEEFSKYQSLSIETTDIANGVYKVVIQQGDKAEVRKLSILK